MVSFHCLFPMPKKNYIIEQVFVVHSFYDVDVFATTFLPAEEASGEQSAVICVSVVGDSWVERG